MDKLFLYFKMLGMSFKSQMQYRASFWMLSTTLFISTFVDFFGIWVLFDRFKMVKGWTFEEVALIYGIVHMGFATAESIARGFDTFSTLVKNGDFDRLLLRPLGTVFQVAVREVQMMRIGRFLQGLVVLIWSCMQLDISFFSSKALIILFAYTSTTALFYGLFVFQASFSFWTTETLELMNITTYGGVESGQYPMSIYHPSFRLFFTIVVPLACAVYYPIAGMLKHETIPYGVGVMLPLTGFVFLWLSFKFWSMGVSHYQSTGN